MFPGLSSPASPTPDRLRRRLVRGLDVAVEFATLGEYGVEEVEVGPREPDSCGWDWPARCSRRGRPAGVHPHPRVRPGAGMACA